MTDFTKPPDSNNDLAQYIAKIHAELPEVLTGCKVASGEELSELIKNTPPRLDKTLGCTWGKGCSLIAVQVVSLQTNQQE